MHVHDADEQLSAQITVHEFQVGEQTSDPLSSSATPGTSVCQAGSKLVRDAVCEAGWKSRRFDSQITLRPPRTDACFLWSLKPPQLPIHDLLSEATALKSWGDPFLEEEFIDIGGLSEFQHVVDIGEPVVRHATQERQTEPAGDVPARKKMKLFFGSLHGIIVQPHFYPSTSDMTTRGQAVQTPPYKKRPPVAIPPYTNVVTLQLHLVSIHARTAWIIPVRGILPWSACTRAVVLDDNEEDIGKEGSWIQWTKTALVEFWAFLVNVRATGKMGRIGVSFHLASVRERELSADTVNEQYSNSTHGINELQVWSQPLSCADYVKVYHEASNAMCLRNILDAWAYECLGRKIRVLKGSKLTLVDECCRGLLVS
ncbi:hypothetical protein APHAL10511_007303 [Amanita phalloides]|nr:hypothetical protein APHAL10511_007303 [Amanita phalloides]